MTQATIYFGTKENPGPMITCEDSLASIRDQLEKYWDEGHWLAVIKAPGWYLTVERPRPNPDDGIWGIIRLRPPQR